MIGLVYRFDIHASCDLVQVLLQEYQVVANSNTPHMLIDVRSSVEYEICSLPNSISILDDRIVCHYHLDNLLISHCLHFIMMVTLWN